MLDGARRELLELRRARIWPGRDEKRLVAWNGLMIAGLAKASRRLGRPDFATAATRAADFIREQMFADGRLSATYKDGRARFPAYLDDYAFLALGLLELLQARWRTEDLAFAVQLVDTILERFADPAGGFFFTADDHEKLIHRSKPLADESIPSGNGVAVLALQALGHIVGETRYLEAAASALRNVLPKLERAPEAHATLLRALANELTPPEIIVVRGEDRALERWRNALDAEHSAGRICLYIPENAADLPGLLADRRPSEVTIAYHCEGMTCRAPVTALDALMSSIARPDG